MQQATCIEGNVSFVVNGQSHYCFGLTKGRQDYFCSLGGGIDPPAEGQLVRVRGKLSEAVARAIFVDTVELL
jgi:hypothetical protein